MEAKVAVTCRAVLSVREQEEVLLVQPPLHPVKVCPVAGVAIKVTVVLRAKSAVQVPLVHVRPEGALETVPLPLPLRVTLRGTVDGGGAVAGVMRI